MKKKKLSGAAIIAAVLTIALCACGKDEPSAVSSSLQSDTSSAETTMQISSAPEAETSSAAESLPSSASSSKAASSKKASSQPAPSKKPVSSAPAKPSAPAAEKSALEIYQKANENYKKWVNKEMTVKMLDQAESPSAFKMTQRQAKKGEALHYSLDYEITLFGENYVVSLYSCGDSMAARNNGVWEKITKEEAEELLLSFGIEAETESSSDLLEDAVVNSSTIIKQSVSMAGGKYQAHIELDPQKAGFDTDDLDLENAKLAELCLDLTVSKDFQIEGIDLTMQVTSTVNGLSVSVTFKTQFTYRQISPGEMTAPEVLTQQTA